MGPKPQFQHRRRPLITAGIADADAQPTIVDDALAEDGGQTSSGCMDGVSFWWHRTATGTPRSIQDVRTDDDASPMVRPEEFNLGAENPGSQSSEAQRGRRLNADRTQACTVRDAAADEAFPTVVDGSDTDSVVNELERDRDAIPVQWSADEDFLSEAGSVAEVESNPEEVVEVMMPQGRPFREALVDFDTWSLQELVSKRVAVMKNIRTIPKRVASSVGRSYGCREVSVKNEDGNCFSFCLDCYFTDLPGEGYRERNWLAVSSCSHRASGLS